LWTLGCGCASMTCVHVKCLMFSRLILSLHCLIWIQTYNNTLNSGVSGCNFRASVDCSTEVAVIVSTLIRKEEDKTSGKALKGDSIHRMLL